MIILISLVFRLCRVILMIFFLLRNILVLSNSDFFRVYEDNQNKLSTAEVDEFIIKWDSVDPYVLITHTLEPDKVLFQTLPSWPFITIGYATDSKPPIVDGNSRINEWTLFETPYQSIKNVESSNEGEIIIFGEIWGSVTFATYELRFSIPREYESNRLLSSQLSFELVVNPVQGTFNRVFLNYWCDSAENFYGFGTQVMLRDH